MNTSHIARTALITLPLLLLSNAALADSEDKKKTGAAESGTPAEEQNAEVQEPSVPPTTIVVVPAPTPPPAPAPAPAPGPAVGTTQTTAAVVTPANEAEQQLATRPPPVGNRVTLEPLVGYGTNNYNLGVGGRLGYTLPVVPIYLGGSFMWYSGDIDHGQNAFGSTESKSNFYYPSAEVGYDIGLGRYRNILIRPYGAAAILFERERVSSDNVAVHDTRNQFMVYPGLTARYRMPEGPLYVGADTRLLVPTLHGHPSYQVFFVTGLSL
ncbi:hypothetical protein AKJ09_05086 [Labilithrix luteola]|uniref:Outer membrane protein beta-barrel domain-containing protein n=1 Tax=Labilithrix luteola TaxID=1391654 RepID=A0A0K1PY37_9BACT|nr:outer membrane beta-barrel protein [Labilithrix luteola]AKU98422.1 hypothetical protein AKJ09_05086 [Labilithrix luteola]